MFMRASKQWGKILTYYQKSFVVRYDENCPPKTHQPRGEKTMDYGGVS